MVGVETLRRDWPVVVWVSMDVTVAGTRALYQTVLALADRVPDTVPERAIVGEVAASGTPVMAYDALADPMTARAFVDRAADGLAGGEVVSAVDEPWATVATLDDHWELRLHRRVEGGAHPDVELPAVLADAGHTFVRPPAAVWRRNQADLAVVRRNVRRTATAAESAVASIDELLRRRCRPSENPLDVEADLTDLGATLARLHVASADALGTTPADGADLADLLAARIPRHVDDAAGERLVATYARLAAADDLGVFVRVHGDLDLSAVDRTKSGWVFTRFGGDPADDLAIRRAPTSPLWDVSGLLHDLSTIAAAALDRAVDVPDDDGYYEQADRRELAVLAEAWEERGVDAVIAGYTSVDDVHRLLPVERISRDALLTVFELERTVRDAARAVAAGPELLRLPLDEVEALIEAPRFSARRRGRPGDRR